ncbi:hypothetical protein DPMN_029565 [Dreissena polymorpha]|uniref:Uncharacterized protein n=1 Tax=Dreissena polymorpha TaxID=45954 RepID=A0A9D4M137_DREPO|nr:hypothetical protein DPMN_029565 [Dreissena polymorpha]
MFFLAFLQRWKKEYTVSVTTTSSKSRFTGLNKNGKRNVLVLHEKKLSSRVKLHRDSRYTTPLFSKVQPDEANVDLDKKLFFPDKLQARRRAEVRGRETTNRDRVNRTLEKQMRGDLLNGKRPPTQSCQKIATKEAGVLGCSP